MTRKRLHICFGVILTFALAVIATGARANESNEASKITFNQPVEIPGNLVLPAGTYWFALTDDAITGSDFVQIFNGDWTQVLATIKAIPILRPEGTDLTELTFAEKSQKQPIALISWFYPGRMTGNEFIYPPREEAKLADSKQIIVLAKTPPLAEVS